MNRRLEARRAAHAQYKRDVERRGKPFYPFAMFHDTVMSLVVVTVIVVLAVVWKYTAEEGPTEDDSGLLGKLYDEKADAGTTSFIPRPDWYFYFLFYLLRIFKWPESVVLGTVGIPTIALVLLLALPFLDVRRERRITRRPVAVVALILTVVAMGTLTYKGATAREALGSQLIQAVPEWAEQQKFADNQEAVEGAELFAVSGCAQCHTYLGIGSSNLGAPDLTDVGGRTDRGVEGFLAFLKNPPQPMAQFIGLGDENLRKISTFLDASKGVEEEG